MRENEKERRWSIRDELNLAASYLAKEGTVGSEQALISIEHALEQIRIDGLASASATSSLVMEVEPSHHPMPQNSVMKARKQIADLISSRVNEKRRTVLESKRHKVAAAHRPKGYSIYDLAEETGMTASFLYAVTNCRLALSESKAERLVKTLELDRDLFLGLVRQSWKKGKSGGDALL